MSADNDLRKRAGLPESTSKAARVSNNSGEPGFYMSVVRIEADDGGSDDDDDDDDDDDSSTCARASCRRTAARVH